MWPLRVVRNAYKCSHTPNFFNFKICAGTRFFFCIRIRWTKNAGKFFQAPQESPKKMWGCGCTCMHSGFSIKGNYTTLKGHMTYKFHWFIWTKIWSLVHHELVSNKIAWYDPKIQNLRSLCLKCFTKFRSSPLVNSVWVISRGKRLNNSQQS